MSEWKEPEWLCAVAENLTEGDEVLVNDRSRSLTVEDREVQSGGGSDYPYKIVWLTGNGTHYRLRYSHLHEYRPNLHSKSQLTTRTHLGQEEVIADGSGETVYQIETANGGETALVADLSAEEFIEPTVENPDTLSGALDGLGEATDADGDELGDCPDCGETVVDDDGRATCTECPLWCPRDEWDAFHGRADQ